VVPHVAEYAVASALAELAAGEEREDPALCKVSRNETMEQVFSWINT